MKYDEFPPSGAILRFQDWLESMSKDEADHSLLLDIVNVCHWPPRLTGASKIGEDFAEGIEFGLPKPLARAPGDENDAPRSMMIDPEGLGMLMLNALAGGTILREAGKSGRYHYLVVAFPGEKTVPVHRLICDAPEDEDAKLPNYHDYRRRSLGALATMGEQRARHGKERVRLAPRGTRRSNIEVAVRHLEQSQMSRFIPEREYRAMFFWLSWFLDDVPLGEQPGE